MSISILCVDDDPNILEGYRRLFGRRFDVYLAEGPLQGLQKLELGPRYAVIISDKHMPDMDGVEFLRRASQRFPSSIRVMLTGDADTETAMDAVNRGNIQRFLQKPCPAATLEKIVDAAVLQYQSQRSSEGLNESRLATAKLMAKALAWSHAEEAGVCERALERAATLARQKGQVLPDEAMVALRLAEVGLLSGKADHVEQVQAGAELLLAMPGWDNAVDLYLQAHGQRPASLMGGLLKLALDMEKTAVHLEEGEPVLEHVRARHLGNPWFRMLEEGDGAQEKTPELMASAA